MPYKDPEKRRIQQKIYRQSQKDNEAYKAMKRKSTQRYQESHQELVRQRKLAYHERKKIDPIYKEKARSRAAAHHLLHREEKIVYARAYYAINKEVIAPKQAIYAAQHKEHKKIYDDTYRRGHREERAASQRRRRAAKANTFCHDLTAAQWREIQITYGHRCVYCGRKMQRLTQDHITPLSKDGLHTAMNVVPACRSCNSRKQAGPPLQPVQPLLLTLASAKPIRKMQPI